VLLTTTNKDFKVKHGLAVANGATFGAAIEVGTPTADNHAATKLYVDSNLPPTNGFFNFEAVMAATTQNINITTDTVVGDFIDGWELAAGHRILIKNQTLAKDNGIYVVNASGPATRSLDFNTSDDIYPGAQIFVLYGTANVETLWVLTSYNNVTLGVDPINFLFVGPEATADFGLIFTTNESGNRSIRIDDLVVATVSTEEDGLQTLATDIQRSSLTELGELSALSVEGTTDLNDLNVLGDTVLNNVTFNEPIGTLNISTEINVPEPTDSTHAVTKDYVDNLLGQESVEITTIDDLSNYFNGYNSRFLPTYQGFPVTLQNPFNLLLTIDGIIQSVGSPDYVWQSVMPRVGFRIDNDGYIAFPEAIPVGSSFDARVLVGSATTTQTKVYPFKAMDIVLGGY
jgi:hypothetical protein